MSRYDLTHYGDFTRCLRLSLRLPKRSSLFWITFIFTICLGCRTAQAFNPFVSSFGFSSEEASFQPRGDGEPRDTVGAGSREGGSCEGGNSIAQRLGSQNFYGLTFQTHPTIFVKLEGEIAQQAILTFSNESETYREQALLPVDVSGEVAQFTLPTSAAPLKVGENYHWSLVLLCDQSAAAQRSQLSGWVQRVALSKNVQSHLHQLSLPERVQWYSSYGYWYDLLSTVNRAYQATPQDTVVAELWQTLVEPEP